MVSYFTLDWFSICYVNKAVNNSVRKTWKAFPLFFFFQNRWWSTILSISTAAYFSRLIRSRVCLWNFCLLLWCKWVGSSGRVVVSNSCQYIPDLFEIVTSFLWWQIRRTHLPPHFWLWLRRQKQLHHGQIRLNTKASRLTLSFLFPLKVVKRVVWSRYKAATAQKSI